MVRPLCVICFVFAVASVARGQTTRAADRTPPPATASRAAPATAEQAWPRAMETFRKALLGGDLDAMDRLLAPRSAIRRFEGPQTEGAWELFERVQKSTLVGAHAYLHPPMVMAADLSADFKTAAAVPERAKARFVVDDETDIKRANATAAQWIGETLGARNGTPVGVVVLWTPRPAPPGVTPVSADGGHDVVFVLCRGEEVKPGEYRITTVVYGRPTAQD
jgi:hypothetical protein